VVSLGELTALEQARLSDWYYADLDRAERGGEGFKWAFVSWKRNAKLVKCAEQQTSSSLMSDKKVRQSAQTNAAELARQKTCENCADRIDNIESAVRQQTEFAQPTRIRPCGDVSAVVVGSSGLF
jgi:hypothetical protein